MNGVLQKLEDSVNAVQQKSIIHLIKNEQLKRSWNILMYYNQAVLNKRVLKILYKSFTARDFSTYTVHPQLLKEFNNRWFLICSYKGSMYNLALDRMENIETDEQSVILIKT